MSITSLPEFNKVSLTLSEEKKLQEMILNGNPGGEDSYPCGLMVLYKDGNPVPVFHPPAVTSRGSTSICYLLAHGFLWNFLISGQEKYLNMISAQKDGSMLIPRISYNDFIERFNPYAPI